MQHRTISLQRPSRCRHHAVGPGRPEPVVDVAMSDDQQRQSKWMDTRRGQMAGITRRRVLIRGFLAAAVLVFGAIATAPHGHADDVAYLVNVTVRPGYNFANADAALAYGHVICDKIVAARGYPQIMDDVMSDFSTSDVYQASYLITQAVNELCPAQIWALRSSAAGYRPSGP